jgi:hypothetical protein
MWLAAASGMTFYEEISALQERLAKAHVERDTWRATGMQEKYLEAHSTVDALEMQLDALRQEGLQNSSRNEQLAVVSAVPDVADDREVLMARFAIGFDGRQYQYDRYRYDRLEDAVSYARLRRATPSAEDEGVALPAARTVRPPDGAQRQLMKGLSITFEDGVYRLGAYRYDRLADAINYARLLRGEGC